MNVQSFWIEKINDFLWHISRGSKVIVCITNRIQNFANFNLPECSLAKKMHLSKVEAEKIHTCYLYLEPQNQPI